jgi:hypothetical protein
MMPSFARYTLLRTGRRLLLLFETCLCVPSRSGPARTPGHGPSVPRPQTQLPGTQRDLRGGQALSGPVRVAGRYGHWTLGRLQTVRGHPAGRCFWTPALSAVLCHVLSLLRHALRHVLRHVLHHVLRHVLRHVLCYVLRHVMSLPCHVLVASAGDGLVARLGPVLQHVPR